MVQWIHVRKSFPCLLLLHFHASLFLSGAFLWLVGSFSSGTVLGAGMSAPIYLFVSKKTSYLRWLFFLSSNMPRFLDATDYLQHWTIFFHKWQLWSNIVLVLGPLFQVQTKFYGGKWSWRTIFPGILVSCTSTCTSSSIILTLCTRANIHVMLLKFHCELRFATQKGSYVQYTCTCTYRIGCINWNGQLNGNPPS